MPESDSCLHRDAVPWDIGRMIGAGHRLTEACDNHAIEKQRKQGTLKCKNILSHARSHRMIILYIQNSLPKVKIFCLLFDEHWRGIAQEGIRLKRLYTQSLKLKIYGQTSLMLSCFCLSGKSSCDFRFLPMTAALSSRTCFNFSVWYRAAGMEFCEQVDVSFVAENIAIFHYVWAVYKYMHKQARLTVTVTNKNPRAAMTWKLKKKLKNRRGAMRKVFHAISNQEVR